MTRNALPSVSKQTPDPRGFAFLEVRFPAVFAVEGSGRAERADGRDHTQAGQAGAPTRFPRKVFSHSALGCLPVLEPLHACKGRRVTSRSQDSCDLSGLTFLFDEGTLSARVQYSGACMDARVTVLPSVCWLRLSRGTILHACKILVGNLPRRTNGTDARRCLGHRACCAPAGKQSATRAGARGLGLPGTMTLHACKTATVGLASHVCEPDPELHLHSCRLSIARPLPACNPAAVCSGPLKDGRRSTAPRSQIPDWAEPIDGLRIYLLRPPVCTVTPSRQRRSPCMHARHQTTGIRVTGRRAFSARMMLLQTGADAPSVRVTPSTYQPTKAGKGVRQIHVPAPGSDGVACIDAHRLSRLPSDSEHEILACMQVDGCANQRRENRTSPGRRGSPFGSVLHACKTRQNHHGQSLAGSGSRGPASSLCLISQNPKEAAMTVRTN